MKLTMSGLLLAAAYLCASFANAAEPTEGAQAKAVTSQLATDMARAKDHADVRLQEVRSAAERIQADTQGMSLDEMRRRYNTPSEKAPCDNEPCADHADHQHGAAHDCAVEPPIEGGLCNPDQHG